ncbi:E3 ubiquitin-protein ligase XIAP-like, partial [Mercenaria mercenaria]|uniref:E3 ubiquitin-protein ligase XIAP-like n=1 Tax=Mercenaria mercenaria TaxID=6596 RepID=UPI00234F672A
FQNDPILTSGLVNLLPTDTESKEESETGTRLACSTNDIRKGEAAVCSCCILKNGKRTNNEYDIGLHKKLSPKLGERTEYRPTEEIQYFPGITNEQPKHPDFATRSARLSSFSHWTLGQMITPENLAEAGFFSSGTKDNVKCFFCGGELQDWKLGDNPWIEHARWFPNCAYVKQCKGVEFVNFCQTTNVDYLPQSQAEEIHGSSLNQTNEVHDQSIKDLNSVAAKLVLNMGYTQELVEKSIKHTREHCNDTDLKAQQLLDYLLDCSDNERSTNPQNTWSSNPLGCDSVSQSQTPTCSLTDDNRSLDKVTGNIAPAGERYSLEEENRHLKEQLMCKICMDKDATVVFLPCGHMVSCVECAHALRKCAVCCSVIQITVRTYPA